MRRGCTIALTVLALACGPSAGRPAGNAAVDSILGAGAGLYAREAFDSAQTWWAARLAVARAAGDSTAQAHLLTWLGKAAWRLGDLDTARARQEQAIAIKTARGMRASLSDSYNALGLVALSAGRNGEATSLFERASAIARATDDPRGVGRASGNLALSYSYVGDPRARPAHHQMREAGRTLGDARMEGNALANEAMADIWAGDPRAALARLDTARVLYARAEYATGVENALGHAASAYTLTGEYNRAFAALDSGLAIARRLGLKEGEARDLTQLAELHARLGDYRRAVRYYEAAESLLTDAGLEGDHAAVLRGSALAHLRLGNQIRARRAAETALVLDEAADERSAQLGDLLLLAEIEARDAAPTRSATRMRSARAVADRIGTRGARIAVAITEATLADLAGDSRRVLAVLRDAAADLEPGDYGAEWEVSALAARAHARSGKLDSATAAGRRAVAAVERLRGSIASEPLRAAYVADRASVYGDLVLVLLRQGRVEEAFLVADGARSRELLRQMSATRSAAAAGTLPPELLEGDLLLRRIDELVRRLRETERGGPTERGPAADSTDSAIAAELAAARTRYEDLMVRAAQASPRAAAILGVRRPRLDEVRAALEPGEALVEYLIAGDRLLAFVLTASGLEVVQLRVDGRTLAQRVRLLRELWGTPSRDWRDGLPAARALHAELIAPVLGPASRARPTRLLIVPHGILAQVPFAALQDTAGRFLIQDFAIAQLPSAGTLPVLRARTGGATPWTGAGSALAPFPRELPATAQEAEALRAAFPRTSVRLGDAASEGALRRALAASGIVHVATHGVLNAVSPMFSRLELARRGSGPDDDGRLEVHEVLGLSVRSPLVFLSGCETGAAVEWTDDPVRGTADLTLAQAVLSAGASNVVVTLWRIDDDGAADFAGRFYRGLAGNDAMEALAAAQRGMATGQRWASPYYWAGYTLTGSGRIPAGPQGRPTASVSSHTRTIPLVAVAGRSTP